MLEKNSFCELKWQTLSVASLEKYEEARDRNSVEDSALGRFSWMSSWSFPSLKKLDQ